MQGNQKVQITALSLGAGWGSVGMALMIEDGYIQARKPDLAIFADTKAEPPHVYETIEWLRPKLSYPILIAAAGDLWTDTWKQITGSGPTINHSYGTDFVDIPVFGDTGILSRQCTSVYKIRVIKRAIRQFAEAAPPRLSVTQYIGISLDEASRMNESQEAYITLKYPLIEAGVNRAAIQAWMKENYPGAPIRRSACFFCPFHSISEWRAIRQLYPGLYDDAVDMERALKKMKRGPFYLYKGKYGLGLETAMANADLQGMLWPEADQFQNECMGHCGV